MMRSFLLLINLMLYIHIPFCHHKCTYCAFYSLAGKHNIQAYVDALCREISERQESQRKVKTIYFGGGTPSLMSLEQIQQICDKINQCFDTLQVEEFTFEANPENLSHEFLLGLKKIGFNRLSIGIQSFKDSDLKILNRVHTSSQALNVIKDAQDVGFSNISVDLIYALPNQSIEDWKQNLSIIDTLNVQHLSCYALTIEEETMLHRQIEMNRIVPISDEQVTDYYNVLCKWASEHGFNQYEVSNFCKSNFYSRHNSRYWNRTTYLGFGAAAHSFDGKKRRWNIADINKYLTRDAYFEEEILTDKDAYNEYMMTALRTTKGIEKCLIEPRFLSYFQQRIKKYCVARLLIETDDAYIPTQEGLMHADGIAADLFI